MKVGNGHLPLDPWPAHVPPLRADHATMEKIQPYLNSHYGAVLAVVMVLVALTLRAMGILAIVVSFWSGFAFCLGIEAFAVYYFLLKLEDKTNAKLEQYVEKRNQRSFSLSNFESIFRPSSHNTHFLLPFI